MSRYILNYIRSNLMQLKIDQERRVIKDQIQRLCVKDVGYTDCVFAIRYTRINTPCYISRPTPTTSRMHIAKSVLRKWKFKHNFQNSTDPLCSCKNNIEPTIPFFLHCANLSFQKETLLNETHTIDPQILTQEAAFFIF